MLTFFLCSIGRPTHLSANRCVDVGLGHRRADRRQFSCHRSELWSASAGQFTSRGFPGERVFPVPPGWSEFAGRSRVVHRFPIQRLCRIEARVASRAQQVCDSRMRILRHYICREPALESHADAAAQPPPSCLDAVLYVRPDEVERFALLRARRIRAVRAANRRPLGVATADGIVAAVSAAVAGPGVVVVPESELVPESVGRAGAPLGVRR